MTPCSLAVTLSREQADGSRESMSYDVPLNGVRLKLARPRGGRVTFHPVPFPDRYCPFTVDTSRRSLIQPSEAEGDGGWRVAGLLLCLPTVRMDIDARRFGWLTHGNDLMYGFRYDLESMFPTRCVRDSVAQENREAAAVAGVLRYRTALLLVASAMRRWLARYRERQVAAARATAELAVFPSDVLDAIEGLVLRE